MNGVFFNSTLKDVLPLCRAEVLQLSYLTATLQNRSTAALILTPCSLPYAQCVSVG
jgi:hypothetical protein